MDDSANGRVVLVSGASGGLAEGVGLGLLEAGYRVHVVGRSMQRLQAWVDRVGQGNVHVGDLGEDGVAAEVVSRVVASEGGLHGLVLGVGPYHAGRLEDTGADVWQGLWKGNLQCAVSLFDGARSALRESGGTALFFGAAGLGGLRARTTTAAYTAMKTALLSYMVSLAKEEAPHGVRINMISPGVVPHGGASEDTNSSATWQQIPMGRPGRVRDVADAALWLMGPQAGHVTGQNLEVAGGFLL